MTNNDIMQMVCKQLAIDYNCTPNDFTRDGFIFCEARENPGRRPFPWFTPRISMITMGGGIIVSATDDQLPIVREQLEGKTRDEAFSMPFVYGLGLYYLPDMTRMSPLQAPDGYTFEFAQKKDIPALYALEGFRNAVQYDVNHPRPDALAIVARHKNEVIGIAGSSEDCKTMWQIGIDVLPVYRGKGIAAVLVDKLKTEILSRGLIPYYATAPSNIASQKVAARAGFVSAWVCIYKARINGELSPALS